jgi:DnaK suppressor protein
MAKAKKITKVVKKTAGKAKASAKSKPAKKQTAKSKPAVKAKTKPVKTPAKKLAKPAAKKVVKKTAVKVASKAKKNVVSKTESIDARSYGSNNSANNHKPITSSKAFLNNPSIPEKPSYKPTPMPPPPNTNPDEKTRYSDEELQEFHVLISDKLDKAKKELIYIKEMLSRKNDEGTDTTAGAVKVLEDGSDTAEKENFTQLAARQQKFVQQLEAAIARIKNGTYGICVETGKLIPKERLRAVPHTQHSIEAKLNRK